MVSLKRYALAALVVTRKHALADAILTDQPDTELRPQETPQAGPDPTTAAFPQNRLERFKRATSAQPPLHTCGYLYGDSVLGLTLNVVLRTGIYLPRRLFLRYVFPVQGFRLLYDDQSMHLSNNLSSLDILGSRKRRRLEQNTILVRDIASCNKAVERFNVAKHVEGDSSNSERPSCAIVQYADPTFSGYTFHLCDSTSTTLPIYYHPQETSLDSSETSSVGYTLTSSSTTPASTTTPPPPPPPTPSSTPVGAIVGGVIGGVAALAGIGLVASLMLRRRRKNRAMSPPRQPFVSETSYPSYGDQRSSIATSAISTPSRGPVPAYSPSRVGQQAQTQGGYWSQIQEMPAASPHGEAHEAHELAT